MDVYPKVKHECNLKLRKATRIVWKEPFTCVVTESRVLKYIGHYGKNMMKVVCEGSV